MTVKHAHNVSAYPSAPLVETPIDSTAQDHAGNARSRLLAAAPPYVLLAVLPFLLLAVNTSWMLTNPESIDGWVYFGYFENPETYLRVFAGTYYGTRLSWILPGAVVHHLLPDFTANIVLHVSVYCAGLVAVYHTLKRAASQRAALVTAVLLGTYSYYLYSTGWDYVDGGGMVYYAAAVATVTAAPRSSWRRSMFVAAGMAFAGAVHTNVLWLAMSLPLTAYAFLVSRPRAWQDLLVDSLALAAGVVACTAALGLVSVSLGSSFLFFLPSLSFAANSAVQPSPFTNPGWILHGRWLIFPIAAFASALAWRVQGIADARRRALVDHFLLAWLTFGLLELVGRPVLEHPFSASFLIPAMALSVGAQLTQPLQQLSAVQYQRIAAATVAAGVLVYASPFASIVFRALWPWPLLSLLLLLASAACVARSARPWSFVTLLFAVGMANVALADGAALDFTARPVRLDSFRAILKASDAVDEIDPGAGALFWYSDRSKFGPVYLAVSSTRLWGYRLVGTRFPSLWNRDSARDTKLEAGERIAILSDEGSALATATEALRPLKLRPSPVAHRVIEDGGVRFHLVFADLVPATP